MSLVNLAHVCSHLQNASKARLGLTSIPMSKLHLKLCLALQHQGMVSSVDVAGTNPPVSPQWMNPDHDVLGHQTANPTTLQLQPWRAYPDPAAASEPAQFKYEVPENPAQRRIWLGLKYWSNRPVLSQMHLISKPSRRLSMGWKEIGILTRGLRQGYVKGVQTPGELIFVGTDIGIMEARECVERKVGGLLLCRAS
ncbi:mitochondrial 37S ribosomal protein S8 [Eremomyces bilateralis CBS 781.70]|uniref:Mitochondrial 37S ribosomal protein S8 n=1 Tax=Eremomyces bilateralis CBS 781.70 TaxID=1392243 RepID=A0A6G1GFU4_9PEZI|nr:mitochondrial 37S ribosomal protein S8 [Eremomyces bilateralis CBS 781.70]KAF1816862.1 mitochondrial 37S ribosomal protein S8 [Eremomyces bilateralis CBS 781.70]